MTEEERYKDFYMARDLFWGSRARTAGQVKHWDGLIRAHGVVPHSDDINEDIRRLHASGVDAEKFLARALLLWG